MADNRGPGTQTAICGMGASRLGVTNRLAEEGDLRLSINGDRRNGLQ